MSEQAPSTQEIERVMRYIARHRKPGAGFAKTHLQAAAQEARRRKRELIAAMFKRYGAELSEGQNTAAAAQETEGGAK